MVGSRQRDKPSRVRSLQYWFAPCQSISFPLSVLVHTSSPTLTTPSPVAGGCFACRVGSGVFGGWVGPLSTLAAGCGSAGFISVWDGSCEFGGVPEYFRQMKTASIKSIDKSINDSMPEIENR